MQVSRLVALANRFFLIMGGGLLLAYLIVAYFRVPPFDYALLMHGAETFCFDSTTFEFGVSATGRNFYPATFYTTFCLPHHLLPHLLLALWLLIPCGLALWLAGFRSAVLVYPPLFILLLLGQSSWLVLPLYILLVYGRETPRWWYGFAFVGLAFKPHIALPAALILCWRWRHTRPILLTGALAVAAVLLPSFIMRPGWLLEWLPKGRGFEPVNLASIAYVPVRLLRLPFDPDPLALLGVWLFCLGVGVALYALLRRRRGELEIYDWILIFFFVLPLLNDYDLVVLLPLIAVRPRRLLLALTAGILTWVYAMMTLQWNMSVLVTAVLLFERFLRVERPRAL